MSLKLGTQDIAGISQNKICNAHFLLEPIWSDHIINDISYLRADSFSWQSGDVYVTAYNHLVQDIQGITAETETVGSYTVTFYRATDGHKICLADQEQTVLNIYNTYGIAWYYILDTTNTQFKLPRTKYGFEGLRTNVGDKIDERLPNITGSTNLFLNENIYSSGTGALKTSPSQYAASEAGGTNRGWQSITFDASRSSSTYQNNAPVQERATQMYLYFYVGDYSQSAIEQTAGLNSELFNGKVDLDASNLSSQGMSYIAGLGMPSVRYQDLTLGASGTTYTAPANGYFSLGKNSTAAGQCASIFVRKPDLSDTLYGKEYSSSKTGQNMKYTWAVSKGSVTGISYDLGGTTNFFRFIYAVGSESEAQ